MISRKYLQNVLIGATAVVFVGAHFAGQDGAGPVLTGAVEFVTGDTDVATFGDSGLMIGKAISSGEASSEGSLSEEARAALEAFGFVVPTLSHPRALEDAFRSYYAYKAEHADDVKKPYLYFVDYGLPSTAKRGYVFDMSSLKVIDGPFTVAHGRGSSKPKQSIPTRFSNAVGSKATSLGLYLAESTYGFRGKAGGRSYTSIGLRLLGMSGGYNDNALLRRVVAHGAPYVTSEKAGRSEGCPAMEPARARRLLPMLAEGGMVFLFAPDAKWMTGDPWIAADAG
jgi:hypothetical protein